ncbi:MAG TPA: HlyD family efflux transporter periplasmic adaptor subunit [Planctomycetota bacterium]
METTAAPSKALDRVLPGPGTHLSRGLFYVILLLLAAAGVWAAYAEVDVVVQARGRVLIEGEPIAISAPEPGMVIEAPARVGARVKKGDILLRLDAFKVAGEASQLDADLRAGIGEAERHREAAKSGRDVLRKVVEEREFARNSISILESQVKGLKSLLEQGAASVFQVNQKEQELNEARSRTSRLDAELQRGETEAVQRERQARELETRLEGVRVKLEQLKESRRQMSVLSPVDGVVTKAAAVHPGRFLSPGEAAVTINPDDRPLMVALQVPNASMRRLRVSMPVRMRLDAYPWQDYGQAAGELVRIDPDADEEGRYRAWVRLSAADVRGPRGVEPLRAGLLLEADVIVERRTVLDLVVRPFRRLGSMTITD